MTSAWWQGWILVILGAMLASCGSVATRHTEEPQLRALSEHGYRPGRHFATATLRETWTAGEASLDVSLTIPVQPGRFPLVVYLPGLGEPASAGILWRQAWAEAGYGVLTVQDTAAGESVWASAQARAGDFSGLARAHFSASSLSRRIRQLEVAVAEFRRRAARGIAPYTEVDSQQIAVTGYDLGAKTAAALAGGAASGAAPQGMAANIRAAILLSPYADAREHDAASRYAGMKIPVLSITGTEDADPFGLVMSPAHRLTSWTAMPPGEKYLLVLAGGSHSVLAGGGFKEAGGSKAIASDAGKSRTSSATEGGHGQHLAGNSGAGAMSGLPAGGHAGSQHGTGATESARAMGDDGRSRESLGPRAFNLEHIAAVRSATLAFLDTALRQDADARYWLAEEAARRLSPSARFESK